MDEKEIQRKRGELLRRLNAVLKSQIAPLDPPPNYDESYWAAVDKLAGSTILNNAAEEQPIAHAPATAGGRCS